MHPSNEDIDQGKDHTMTIEATFNMNKIIKNILKIIFIVSSYLILNYMNIFSLSMKEVYFVYIYYA